MAFEDESTETLEKIRDNLLRGVDKLVSHYEAGTLHEFGGKNSTPAEMGNITVALLNQVTNELIRRSVGSD